MQLGKKEDVLIGLISQIGLADAHVAALVLVRF
jgi:hypothetical protein